MLCIALHCLIIACMATQLLVEVEVVSLLGSDLKVRKRAILCNCKVSIR